MAPGRTRASPTRQAALEQSARLTIIHVKAGRYDENVLVGKTKTNLVFLGDGKEVTMVAGGRSVDDKWLMFDTATFDGFGFMKRDMSVENWAGPAKHQAVALRVSANHAVVYRCNITGYQDTLYTDRGNQFYREVDVYGTVDFGPVLFDWCFHRSGWSWVAHGNGGVQKLLKNYSPVLFDCCHLSLLSELFVEMSIIPMD